MVDGKPLLDLDYGEDSRAEVDCSVVLTAAGEFVEVQCTAEGQPLDQAMPDTLLNLAEKGIRELLAIQQRVLANRSSSV